MQTIRYQPLSNPHFTIEFCGGMAKGQKVSLQLWLRPESNRLCLHYYVEVNEQSADGDIPPSLSFPPLHPHFISRGNDKRKKKMETTHRMARA
jgi:hypothetical protein